MKLGRMEIAMPALGHWIVEQGAPAPGPGLDFREQQCWQDPTTPLSIALVRSDLGMFHRLRLGVEIAVDVMADGRIITRHADDLPQLSVDHFLADQVLPRLLAHEGALVVHAGAVKVGSSAIMVLGHSGRGKSTLTASFDRSGNSLLGDDAMILSIAERKPTVCAVYPSLRLFPDSIDALMAGESTAGPVSHYSTKQRIDVPLNCNAATAQLPVAAMFMLAPSFSDQQISIRPLTLAACCMMLVESSFSLDPSDVEQARRRLADASAVARAVPAFEIAYPRDYARLADVRQAILDQVAALEQ